jgi:hypothetical protein
MRFKIFFVLCVVSANVFAQNNLLRPGYWQQEVDYKIDVTLDDSLHVLKGHLDLAYKNNSPDTLSYLVFHLWPNAYSSKNTALAKQLLNTGSTALAFATPDEMGGIDSLAFTLNDLPCVVLYNEKHQDICTLMLEKPLLPGNSLNVKTPFRVKLPSGKISRLGHLGQSYQITQWYPKPAVYDHKGWHAMPYLNQGEFFSEFGTFDVSITLPSNYTVGATGNLQTAAEIKRLDSLSKANQAQQDDKLTDLLEKEDEGPEFPSSSKKFKTIQYTERDVHDFAWFADKRFIVQKGEIELPGSSEKVTSLAMYTPRNAKQWRNSISYINDAITYYSKWNGNYPYKQVTAVDGTISAGGGMEYPGVTVIGNMQSAFLLETVIMHEVGHNWFYGILGSNERDHAWLDEGLNSYNEMRYLNTKYPEAYMYLGESDLNVISKTGLEKYKPGDGQYLNYLLSARANGDQPLSIKSEDYGSMNYGTVVYAKSAAIFGYLQAYLGDEKMDALLHAYFETYKFKHPYPEDFRALAETYLNEDLSWLFDGLIATTEKIDYKLRKVKASNGKVSIHVKNTGGINGPVPLGVYASNESQEPSQMIWIPGFSRDTVLEIETKPHRVSIDPNNVVPEVQRNNNYWRSNAIFNRYEPLKAYFLGNLDDPKETQFYYLPIFGLNYPSGLMPGFAIYNSILPVKKFNYLLAPMYSIKTNTIAGTGELYYMFKPISSSFQSIDLGVRGKRFVEDFNFSVPSIAYNRIQPYIRFDFRPPNPAGKFDHEMVFNAVFTSRQTMEDVKPITTSEQFYRLDYYADYDHPIYKSDITLNNEFHEQYFRTALTLNQRMNISGKFWLRSRLFFGYFINNASNDPRFNWRMDGQFGQFDYAYDHLLFDRSTTDPLLSRQMTQSHGAFKLPTAVAQSNLGILAYNFEFQPRKFPFGVYMDLGTSLNNASLQYNSGVMISMFDGFFAVYAPLIWSQGIENERLANGRNMPDFIRFQFNLNRLNIMDLRRKIGF